MELNCFHLILSTLCIWLSKKFTRPLEVNQVLSVVIQFVMSQRLGCFLINLTNVHLIHELSLFIYQTTNTL